LICPITLISINLFGNCRGLAKIIYIGSKYKLLKALEDPHQVDRVRIEKGQDLRVMVLVNRDGCDCVELKAILGHGAPAPGTVFAKKSAWSSEHSRSRFVKIRGSGSNCS